MVAMHDTTLFQCVAVVAVVVAVELPLPPQDDLRSYALKADELVTVDACV